jgi:hypothetical protein
MKKEYIIGGLALLGVVGVVSYLRKPKRNSEGFFGANGKMSRSSGGCYICRTSPTSISGYYAINGNCRQGDYCSKSVKQIINA